MNVTVTRTGGSTGAASVNYATGNGTATGGASCGAGIDYVAASGTLNFANGETSKSVTVQLCQDTAAESPETLNLILSNPSSGTALGSPSSAMLTINPAVAPARQFCNPVPIDIAFDGTSAGRAGPYPSNINVTGMSGVVRTVSVTLDSIQHGTAADIDMLLVSPTGQKFILMSDVGGGLGLEHRRNPDIDRRCDSRIADHEYGDSDRRLSADESRRGRWLSCACSRLSPTRNLRRPAPPRSRPLLPDSVPTESGASTSLTTTPGRPDASMGAGVSA